MSNCTFSQETKGKSRRRLSKTQSAAPSAAPRSSKPSVPSRDDLHVLIAKRAYEFYAERGSRHGYAQEDVASAGCAMPALWWIDGPQLHSFFGKRLRGQTDEAVALCQLRRVPGYLHPGQPMENPCADTPVREARIRATIRWTAAREATPK